MNMENKISNISDNQLATLVRHDIESTKLTVLPSEAEYVELNKPSILWFKQEKWSEPRYKCPKCDEGGMRREEDMIYTSNPPCHRYECDKCGYSTFHHF